MQELKKTLRWFGPDFGVSLQDIKQTGATGVVNALYTIPTGEVWGKEAINSVKKEIEEAGLNWSVVESVNVQESIKTNSADAKKHIANYIETLHNLGESGIDTVCYNFMPVLDWTRTDLDFKLGDGSSALKYDYTAVAAFDLFLLERKGAVKEYDDAMVQKSKKYLDSLDENAVTLLKRTIMAGLPGTRDVLPMDVFKAHLKKYEGIDADQLRTNLANFLKAVIPEAEKAGVKMCIHPDDPPYPIFGLPRVVSTKADLQHLLDSAPSYHNGLTFCTGSLGARADNDLVSLFKAFAEKVHFLHLRSVKLQEDKSFYEANHLEGSAPMAAIMEVIIKEQQRRQANGLPDVNIPVRPDHGHLMLNDVPNKDSFYPGYSTIGRMKGLAELNGLERGLRHSLKIN